MRTSKCDLLRKKGLVDVNKVGILMQKEKKNYPELSRRILNAFTSVLIRGRWGDLIRIEEEEAELE